METMPKIQRVLAVHDLSSFGRCALTVVMPVLSAMGIQVIPLPTALLSTHTGGFDNFYFEDLTAAMKPICHHLKETGVTFDAIYTGYLGSTEQVDILLDIVKDFRSEDCRVLVDPVFGDDGVLYKNCTAEMVREMSLLCQSAEVITPNLTEAYALCGMPYGETAAMQREDALAVARDLLLQLRERFGCDVVITGVEARDGDRKIVMTCGAQMAQQPFYIQTDKIGAGYPGTGELFASVLLGKVLQGTCLRDAAEYASLYTGRVIDASTRYPTARREGVALEPCLHILTEDCVCGKQ